MPTSSAGATNNRGVTLLEMLIVVALIALIAGLSYPSISSGLDAVRMRTVSDDVVGFLANALDRADRRQQVVEIQVIPAANTLLARSLDVAYTRQLQLPQPFRIASISPPLAAQAPADQPRRFLVYPGGTVPQIGIEIVHPKGRRRMVSLDPITATPRAVAP
jgi:prepilin-type N-terminal cleavage/methylation domain-containing protein